MMFSAPLIRRFVPVPDLSQYQRYLFIGPHPDDIEIGAGASAAALAAAGKDVCFLVCTDGRYGTDHLAAELEPEQLAALRRLEAIDSARELGVSDVRFLEFCDGGFYDYSDLKNAIAAVMADFQPDVVFAPDPTVRSESHLDHLNCGRAVKELLQFVGNPGIMARMGLNAFPLQAAAYYMTCNTNRYLRTDGFLPLQLAALRCHASQYPMGDPATDALLLYLKIRAHDAGLHLFCRTAEGFRVEGMIHTHCLPEAK